MINNTWHHTMNTAARLFPVIQWAARITGSLLLAFLLFMLVGHLVGDANGPTGMQFSTNKEFIAFLFFPVTTIIGLALAYTREGLGGLLAMGSLIVLFILRTDLVQGRFLVMLIPGLLYLVHGWMAQRSAPAA